MTQNNDMQDKIGRLKEVWRAEFKAVKQEMDRLSRRLDELKQKLQAADEILKATESEQMPVNQPALSGLGKYANTGATEAIKDYFSSHPSEELSISDLLTRLQQEGFPASENYKNQKTTIFITCKRLVNDTYLKTKLKGNLRLFALHPRQLLT